MKYEDKLTLRLKKNLNKYFPGENLRITKIKKVSELYKDTLETRTYKCVLSGIRPKVMYLKHFANYKIKKFKEIKEIKKFDKYRSELKIPKIYDFYKDLNLAVLEGVDGIKLSKLFPIYLLPGLKTFYSRKIEDILKEVAQAVAKLHTTTKRKKAKQILTRSFNDLKLKNILFDGNKIKMIDFEMVETNYMEDLVSFMTSLEMLQKFPHISRNDFIRMKNIFYKKYSSNIGWKIDYELLRKMMKEKRYEILQTLRNKNARRGTGFFEKIIIEWNIRYMKNKLKSNA